MGKNKVENKNNYFPKEEFANELMNSQIRPAPREARSQKAQYESIGTPGAGRKDKKIKMLRKTT